MEYNDTIILSKKGFYIDKHLMLPIGIRSGYRFWGVYESTGAAASNLILSSLPHASWGGLLRLRMRLKNSQMIMPVVNDIALIFKDIFCEETKTDSIESIDHINILSLNTSISIDSHHIVSMIVELPKYRKHAFRYTSYKEGYEILASIANKVFIRMKDYDSIMSSLYERDGFINFEIKPIKSLLNEFVSDSYNQLIRFKYDMESMLLMPCEKSDESKLLKQHDLSTSQEELKLPLLYVAIFDPLSKIIRLHPVNKKKLFEIDIDYNILSKVTQDHHNVATRKTECLTCRLVEKVKLRDSIDISTIKKITTRYSKNHEKGSINIKVRTKDTENNFIDNIKSAFSQEENAKINVKRVSQYKVFISLRQDFKKERWDFIKLALSEYGLEAITTDDSTETSITRKVIDDMKSAVACIQIYSLCDDSVRKIKDGDMRFSLDLLNSEWLLFEWGVARSLGLASIVRMADTTHVAKYNWEKYLRIDRDGYLETFQTYSIPSADNHFCMTFKKIAKDMAMQIYKHQ